MGHGGWRSHVRNVIARIRPRRVVAIGIGVHQQPSGGWNRPSSEHREWVNLMKDWHVSWRGDRGAHLMREAGLVAPVVGDPALMLNPKPMRSPQEERVGLVVGQGAPAWSDSAEAFDSIVESLSRESAIDSRRARVLVCNPGDRKASLRLRHSLQRAGWECDIAATYTAADFAAGLTGCKLLIAERLHACVLGVAADIPVVQIAYENKGLDFASAMNGLIPTIRVNRLNANRLSALMYESMEDGRRRLVRLQVEELRSRLRRDIARANLI